MKSIQYTIRGISGRVDSCARERAAREGKSLNETLLQALTNGLGIGGDRVRHTDLDDLAGTWVSDPEFDKALAQMDQVDPELWK